jgi:hypothetical protein
VQQLTDNNISANARAAADTRSLCTWSNNAAALLIQCENQISYAPPDLALFYPSEKQPRFLILVPASIRGAFDRRDYGSALAELAKAEAVNVKNKTVPIEFDRTKKPAKPDGELV